MTVSQWLDRWLDVYKRRSCRPKTLEGYAVLAGHIGAAIGSVELTAVTPEDVQICINARLDAGQSRQAVGVYVVLHDALRRAVRSRLIPCNPCDLIDKPRHTPQHGRAISAEDLRRILQEAEASCPYWPALAVMLYAGLRRGEVCALRWPDVDLTARIIHVRASMVRVGGQLVTGAPKSDAGTRDVPVSAALYPVLCAARRAAPFGRVCPCAPETLGHHWQALQLRCGIKRPYTLHDLRHTCATRWIGRGMVPKHAQYLLGHATLSLTVDLYAHHDLDAIRADFALVDSAAFLH